MTRNQKKDIATSLTSLTFLVIGITGVMMFFHIFDKYTKDLHEILGLVFVLAVVFHVIFNFKSMKQYFSKKIFLGTSLATIFVTLLFIFNTPDEKSSKEILFKGVFESKIEKSFALYTDNIGEAYDKLAIAGISINNYKTINEIAKGNKTSPFQILQIISK